MSVLLACGGVSRERFALRRGRRDGSRFVGIAIELWHGPDPDTNQELLWSNKARIRPIHPSDPALGRPTITSAQRRAFAAAFLGWMVDGYDATILTLVLIDIMRDLSIESAAAAGAIGTVTLVTRLPGGIAAGYAADRWGRKLPLMLSILWFSGFAFLSGFSNSYWMLFALRAMFGFGMGAEWAAGMPLVLEHWPVRLRGLVSGIVQGAYSWGFILAALVFHFGYARISPDSSLGWRSMLWSAIVPAVIVIWIRRDVPESPVWLAKQAERSHTTGPRTAVWDREVISLAVRATLVLGALMFAYVSMTFWYPTFLRQAGREPLLYLVALNVGGIGGAAVCGLLAGSRLGHRGTITLAVLSSTAVLPWFLDVSTADGQALGALIMGVSGGGVIGIAPAYVARQFSPAMRALGSGVVYHGAATVGAAAPFLLGALKDAAWPLGHAMALCIGTAGLVAVLLVWSGPEGADTV